MVQISLDDIVEFGEPSQIQTSLGDLTNLTFLPPPGTVYFQFGIFKRDENF